MKRLLLTGASGYLGQHLLSLLDRNGRVWAGYHQHSLPNQAGITPVALDLADADAVNALVREVRPHAVLHTAIARDPAAFDAVIVRGSAHIAAASAAVGARLVHLSTDIVFDGTADKYGEDAQPCPEPAPGQPDPLNAHGRAKARAEHAVRAHHPDPVIVRTSLIYGFAPLDHSTRWLAEGLTQGRRVTLFTDQIRCPIYAPDLAASLIELLDLPFTGVLNLAGPVALSRYDFGLLLCQKLGLDPTAIHAAPTPPDFIAPRRLVLDDALARQLLRTPRRAPAEMRMAGDNSPPDSRRPT